MSKTDVSPCGHETRLLVHVDDEDGQGEACMQCNAELAWPRHTPGPWFLEKGALASAGEFRIKIVSPWIEGSWTEDAETAANMQIMAAAPDMLKALRGLLELLGPSDDDRVTQAEVAVAMATGEMPRSR